VDEADIFLGKVGKIFPDSKILKTGESEIGGNASLAFYGMNAPALPPRL